MKTTRYHEINTRNLADKSKGIRCEVPGARRKVT